MALRQRLSPTTKDISTLYGMYQSGQLILRPDYQRLSVWPRSAKAYLIDTILSNKPIPMLFLDKSLETGTNRMIFKVIDGQQRLRAVFGFIEGQFRTSNTELADIDRKKFNTLPENIKQQFLSYDFVIMELFGFDEDDMRDIFMRMNRYVVCLNPQELRQAASADSPFGELVTRLSQESEWEQINFFSDRRKERQQDIEFLSELAILFWDGPQDKKGSLDSYYEAKKEQLGNEADLIDVFRRCLRFIIDNIPDFHNTVFAKRPDFYGLMGALYEILGAEDYDKDVPRLSPSAGRNLLEFSERINAPSLEKLPDNELSALRAYLESTSRQTDNLIPRRNRIQIVKGILLGTPSEEDQAV